MSTANKNTQVNFKTNRTLLEKAREIITSHNLDMTTSFNLFLEYVVQNKSLPFETENDLEKRRILEELRSEIKQSFDDLENGDIYSMSEVKNYLGI